MATVNLYSPALQSSTANSELDFEIFHVLPDCRVESLGWVKLTPKKFNVPIVVRADEPVFINLSYFQSDLLVATNSRGAVNFAIIPKNGSGPVLRILRPPVETPGRQGTETLKKPPSQAIRVQKEN